MVKSLITCDCMGSQKIDSAELSQATGLDVQPPCSALCTTQIDRAADALATGDTIFSCTQEARVFEALADEIGAAPPPVLDLRDRAGWSADPASKLPKMSALVAEALLPAAAEKTVDVVSEGLCLILGAPDLALATAEQLQDHLAVTVLLEQPAPLPDSRSFDIIVGHLRSAVGALGDFRVRIDRLQQTVPGGRGALSFGEPRDGGQSECHHADVVA